MKHRKGIEGSLRHIINYKVLKRPLVISSLRLRLRHIINYKVLKQLRAGCLTYAGLRHIINYKVLKLGLWHMPSFLSLRHIINYKVLKPQTSNLKPQIGHHRTHTTCDSCNLCTLLFYNQTPVAVNNMTPIFYVCQFQLPLLKKYKVYLFILSRLA